ncbi:unnamed protein product [Pylaiella littoralis]
MTYFWRRVFDQKLQQAISNAYLLFCTWAELLHAQCKVILVSRTEGGDAASAGATAESDDLTVGELEEFVGHVKYMIKMERAHWDRRLARILMAQCNLGHEDHGARRTRKVVPQYSSTGATTAKVCRGGVCRKPAGSTSLYRSARTHGVCWCGICSDGKGTARAVHLCKKCKESPAAHVAAAADANRNYTPINWAD